MKILFYIFVLLSISNCSDDAFQKLEINQTITVYNTGSYYYFEPNEEYNFVQVRLSSPLSDITIYNRYYETDNITEIIQEPPSRYNYNETTFYLDSSHNYIYIHFQKLPNIKTICFRLSTLYFYYRRIDVKRGHLFQVKQNEELDFDNVYLNVYHINRHDLSKKGNSIGFYIPNTILKAVNAISKESKTYEGSIYI